MEALPNSFYLLEHVLKIFLLASKCKTWRQLLRYTSLLKKKNPFFRLQPAVQVILLTGALPYRVLVLPPELMRRRATLRAPTADWCIFRVRWVGEGEQTTCLVTFCLCQSGRSIAPASYIIKAPVGYWLRHCWLWPQELWVALYSHKVSHHYSCGHWSLSSEEVENVNRVWFLCATNKRGRPIYDHKRFLSVEPPRQSPKCSLSHVC